MAVLSTLVPNARKRGGDARCIAASLAVLLLFAAPAAATPVVTQFTLPNNMQVVVVPDHRAPVVTQMIWYRVGGTDDPPGHSGLAHFFEHMMFRGTKAAPNDSFSRLVAKNGGEDNAFTTEDYTAFYEQIARDRLRLVMGLEADRMVHLDLTDAGVGTERDVVLEERRMRVDSSPSALAGEQVDAALYLSHPYGRPVIGWPQEVHRLDRVQAQSFYDRHYAPNNAILVVVGDVTPDGVKADAMATLARVPARPLEPRIDFAEPQRLGPTRLSIARSDAPVPSYSRTWRVASYAQRKPGQAEALDILAQLLGGDSTGVLYRRLVVEQKLATEAGANYDGDARDSGAFSVYAVPRPGVSLAAIERAIDQVLAGFARTPPAVPDLAHAKTKLVANEVYRADNQLSLATLYGQSLVVGLTVADLQDWPRRIGAVSPQGVRAAASQWLIPSESVTLYLTPAGP